MRKIALILLLSLVVILLRWRPDQLQAGCDYPLPYRIGEVDERFRLGPVTLRKIVEDGAATWENVSGQDLFVYDAAADFTINLVFDERQSETLVRKRTTRRLDHTESSIRDGAAYLESSAKTFEASRREFEQASAIYADRLTAHNADVAHWNSRGSIPRQTRARLEAERSQLGAMANELEDTRLRLNQDADYLNRLSEERTQLIENYNQGVDTINSLPTTTVEFHSGIYQGDKIEIYQFWNERDLTLVVAHELGHALGIGHLESSDAVMHFTRTDPDSAKEKVTLTSLDIDALENVCGNRRVAKNN